jgi:hypothetical protein
MKVFFSLPKSGEGEAFFTRYASLIPTTNLLSYLAQVVSALTEFGILYALIYSYAADILPEHAHYVAGVGATLGTAFIELGLRKFGPFAARAILYKRKQGLDWWMSAFSLGTCIVLLACSGLLSFKGSKATVTNLAPLPVELTTTVADSTNLATRTAINAAQANELAQVENEHLQQIDAAQAVARSQVSRYQLKADNYTERESRTGKVYATAKARATETAAAAQATGEANVAQLRKEQAQALERVRSQYRQRLATAAADYRAAVGKVESTNLGAVEAHQATVNKYGNGLAYFTLICLGTFVVCISLEEIHRKGSGMEEQVEPSSFAFEPGLITALIGAVKEKVLTKGYNRIHKIEQTTAQALEPITPPALWSRQRKGIVRYLSGTGHARTTSPAAPSSGTKPVIAASEDLANEAMGLIRESIKYTSENHHEVAAELELQANEVLRQYLGPTATTEAITGLRWACVHHLNGEGANPFEHHHYRRQIGFKTETSAPVQTGAGDGNNVTRITGAVNAGTPEATERIIYVDKNSKPCAHCGELFLPRHKLHKYCKEDCRMSSHAAKHGGKGFKPNYKAWRDK